MARVVTARNAVSTNPLKMSQPLGAALAFLGLDRCMPLFHGSQGCTSFGLVLLVRHFKEAIPLQTTAMSEVATVLGGYENVVEAVRNIVRRADPDVIGIATTGVTETKGDDLKGFIRLIRQNHPELDHVTLIPVATPDFKGALQDGYAAAVEAMVDTLVRPPTGEPNPRRVNILAGSHLTPGDIEELRDIVESFGLAPLFVPDLSGSLDGHVPEDFTPTTLGGAPVHAIAAMGEAAHTLALGAQMDRAASLYEARTGRPVTRFDSVTGLAATDALVAALMAMSGRPAPPRLRRQRGQLVDAMLDGHFHFGGRRVAIGLEPDLLFAVSGLFAALGADVVSAVTTTASRLNAQVPADTVTIGDLGTLEHQAAAAGAQMLVTHSHGRQAAERLGIPLMRLGLPLFDRLGAGHRVSVGYRGARDLIFEVSNIVLSGLHDPAPDAWPLLSAATPVPEEACP